MLGKDEGAERDAEGLVEHWVQTEQCLLGGRPGDRDQCGRQWGCIEQRSLVPGVLGKYEGVAGIEGMQIHSTDLEGCIE